MKMRWLLPLSLALCHALLTVLVFLVAFRSPNASLLPIIIFEVDLPFSFVIVVLSKAVGEPMGYLAKSLVDMSFFLVLGSVWWFAIGYIIVLAVSNVMDRAKRPKTVV